MPTGSRPAQVAVEVEVDRSRQVAGLVRHPAGTRLAEIPANVDDAQRRIVDAAGQLVDGDERR
jgi:hypothetical protein